MAYYPVGSGKQISIFASELAAAIDQHPHQTQEETACKVWKRFDRPSFAFSLSLAHATEVFEICKKYVKGKLMRNLLPDEVESELGKQQFTNSLKEIFSDLQWRTLRLKIMNFVDTKELPEAQQQVLLNLLGESERVNQAVATLCSEEKKSVQEKVEEVCKSKVNTSYGNMQAQLGQAINESSRGRVSRVSHSFLNATYRLLRYP